MALLVFESGVWAKSLSRPFAEQVFECVYRVVGADGDIATGFFVSCADSSGDASSLLVTARHVFDNVDGDTINVYLRKQNERNVYEVFAYPVPIRSGDTSLYISHPDSTVDLAVVAVPLPPGFTVRVANKALLADLSAFNRYEIAPGGPVHYLGYPRGYSSGEGDFPILRTGAAASYPIDPKRLFLIDGVVYEGNSGGLVYVDPPLGFNRQNRLEKPAAMIVGVLTTSIARRTDDSSSAEGDTREYLNLGGVTSSVRLLELLEIVGCR